MYYYSHGESYGIKEFCKACAGLNGYLLAIIGEYEKKPILNMTTIYTPWTELLQYFNVELE